MNGNMVSGIQLKVSLARRQPVIEPINDASSSASWSTIGKSLGFKLPGYIFNFYICFQLLEILKKDRTKISEIW